MITSLTWLLIGCTLWAGHTVALAVIMVQLLRTRTVLVTCIGGGMQLLVVAATYAWLPSFLNRYYGLAPGAAGVKTGLIVLLGGLGAVAWGMLADRLSGRLACARLYVPAIAAFLSDNELKFLGFEVAPHVAHRYAERFPGDGAKTDLYNWNLFEHDNPDTFIATYQFWAQKRPGAVSP